MGGHSDVSEFGIVIEETALKHVFFAVHGAGHATKSWDMVEDAENLSRTINEVAKNLAVLKGEVW